MVRGLFSVEIPLVSAKGTRVENRYSSRALALVDYVLRSPQRLQSADTAGGLRCPSFYGPSCLYLRDIYE